MKASELIEELKKMPKNASVNFGYKWFNCSGHGPEEYCYCGYEEERKEVSSIDLVRLDKDGCELKKEEVLLQGD